MFAYGNGGAVDGVERDKIVGEEMLEGLHKFVKEDCAVNFSAPFPVWMFVDDDSSESEKKYKN